MAENSRKNEFFERESIAIMQNWKITLERLYYRGRCFNRKSQKWTVSKIQNLTIGLRSPQLKRSWSFFAVRRNCWIPFFPPGQSVRHSTTKVWIAWLKRWVSRMTSNEWPHIYSHWLKVLLLRFADQPNCPCWEAQKQSSFRVALCRRWPCNNWVPHWDFSFQLS